jgi:hypothetical protein
MKINPYRLVEHIAITIMVSIGVTFLCVVATMLHVWRGVGWAALVVVGLCLIHVGVSEWESRKALWDAAHPRAEEEAT